MRLPRNIRLRLDRLTRVRSQIRPVGIQLARLDNQLSRLQTGITNVASKVEDLRAIVLEVNHNVVDLQSRHDAIEQEVEMLSAASLQIEMATRDLLGAAVVPQARPIE